MAMNSEEKKKLSETDICDLHYTSHQERRLGSNEANSTRIFTL